MTNSTRQAGIFPLACAALIPVGLVRLRKSISFEGLLLAAFLTAPIAIVLTGTLDLHRYRALVVLPLGVLVATYGLEYLWNTKSQIWKWIAILLVASVPFQFAGFYRDYIGPYRTSSSTWFGKDLRGALLAVLQQRGAADRVYVSDTIPYNAVYWQFYARKAGQAGVAAMRETADQQFDPSQPPGGSWLVVAGDEPRVAAIERAGWIRQQTINEPDGELSFLVYRKMN